MSGLPPVVYSKDEWEQFAASRLSNERHKTADDSSDYWAPVGLPGSKDAHWPNGLQGISVKTAQVTPPSADAALTVRTKVSTTIQYAEAGPVDATSAVLLIHGFGESWRIWQATMLAQSELGLTKRMIAVDLRGFGGSSPSDQMSSAHSVGHHMDDMIGLMNALGLERVCVVSHSVGSLVALRMASEYPERVASLLLVSGASCFKENKAVDAWRDGLVRLSEEGSAAVGESEPATMDFINDFLGSRFADPEAVQGQTLQGLQQALRIPHRSVLRANIQSVLRQDLSDDLHCLAIPVTLVHGSEDCVVSEQEQAVMLDALPHGNIRVIPGAAHMVPVEQPRTLARILQSYAFINEEHYAIGSDEIVGLHLQTQLRLANMGSDGFLANEDYCHP